jgi:outer membrane protein
MRLLKPVAFTALLGATVPAMLVGQAPSPSQQPRSASSASLTLDEAISLARQNNPLYLQTANERKSADAQVRAAYGALLPSSNAQFYSGYQQGGDIFVNGGSLAVGSDQLQSQYYLGLSYHVNAGTLVQPRAAKANRVAADADIYGASETMRSLVTQQYIAVLRADANASLQDTLVQVQRANLELAKARVAVGADNILAVRRAEVTLGQAEVAALTAHNAAEVARVVLFQQIGSAATRRGSVDDDLCRREAKLLARFRVGSRTPCEPGGPGVAPARALGRLECARRAVELHPNVEPLHWVERYLVPVHEF